MIEPVNPVVCWCCEYCSAKIKGANNGKFWKSHEKCPKCVKNNATVKK